MDFLQFSKGVQERAFPLDFPGHFIGGKWHQPQKPVQTKESYNPNNGSELLFINTNRRIIQDAIDSSVKAEARLAKLTIDERLEILDRLRRGLVEYEELTLLAMKIGTGKPGWEAKVDFDNALQYLDQICEKAPTMDELLLATFRRNSGVSNNLKLYPVGTTLAYLPLFTPITSFVQYFSAAVLSGCPLLLFSSPHAALSGLLYTYIGQLLDFEPGVLNSVFGNFQLLKQVLPDKRIRAIFYRGSREHCLVIRKESQQVAGRQLILKSGGKNSVIVHESADIDTAIRCVCWGAFKNAGQLCSSTSRVFVAESVFRSFIDNLDKALGRLKVGPTDGDDEPFMGPLYSQKAQKKFLQFQTMGQREASSSLSRGRIMEEYKKGYFVHPGAHIMESFNDNSAYQFNVLMCPDIAIYRYGDLDEAITNSNTTDAPLAVSFIGEPDYCRGLRERFIAPNLMINLPTIELEANIPVSGKLQCGGHRLNGMGLSFFLTYPQAMLEGQNFTEQFDAWPQI